jgi:dTDP-glucose pyrophosphorylase
MSRPLPLVSPAQSIRDTIAAIDQHGLGIAIAVDADDSLAGTITDGDVRRAMLAGVDLDARVSTLLERRAADPLTAPIGTTPAELVALMQHAKLRHVPLVDADGRVADVAVLDELVATGDSPLRAVVMAGGFGRRLAPLTDEVPKPMLPVGDRPLLQRIVEQLRDAGIRHVNLTTHYRAEAIAEHFGDGSEFGVHIEYVSEERPLGTAGALALVESEDPLLVMNGDILTRVDFRALHRFHEEHEADMTVAVRPYETQVPFGLIELDDDRVVAIDEKPLLRGFVNAGIYLLGRDVRGVVERGEPLEMPELISRLVAEGRRVVGFPLREYWLDIGHPPDYEQALVDAERR